ncbi:hypothetical protein HN51_006703 [Arachis hypogaea]
MTSMTKVPKCLFVLLMVLNCVVIIARPLNIIETSSSHKLSNAPLSLGGIKDSGPSGGGIGHKATNLHNLSIGGIKNSGPSSGGKGH